MNGVYCVSLAQLSTFRSHRLFSLCISSHIIILHPWYGKNRNTIEPPPLYLRHNFKLTVYVNEYSRKHTHTNTQWHNLTWYSNRLINRSGTSVILHCFSMCISYMSFVKEKRKDVDGPLLNEQPHYKCKYTRIYYICSQIYVL